MTLTKISAFILGIGVSMSALAYPTWNVNDTATAYAGANPNNTVDVLNGRYTGSITQTFVNQGVIGSTFYVNNTFTESGVADLTSYFLGNTGVSTGLGAPGSISIPNIGTFPLNGYKIFGVFDVAGTTTFATSGGVTSLTGTFSSGTVSLYLDANRDSVTSSGGGILNATIGVDDKKIGSASLIQSSSIVIANLADTKGSYGVTFSDFSLTAFGKSYWNSPDPFHKIFTLSGENENFSPALVAGNYTGNVFGDASVNAEIPEPSSLALLGFSLIGLRTLRRKKQS